MPGRHSPLKLEERRDRARRRGFLRPRPDDPTKQFLQVPIELAPRAKAITDSLVIQSAHNSISGKAVPIARASARAARAYLDPEEYRAALHTHDRANVAKHVWGEPAFEDDSDGAGAASCPSSPAAAVQDCIQVLHTATPLPPSSGALPPCCDIATQTDPCGPASSLDPGALEFFPTCTEDSGMPPLAWDPWARLFEVQNSSLALLCARLDECLPSQRRVKNLEKRLDACDASVDTLRRSMTEAITERVASLGARIHADNGAQLELVIKKALDTIHASAADSLCGTLRVSLSELSDRFQGLVSNILERLAALETHGARSSALLEQDFDREVSEAAAKAVPCGGACPGQCDLAPPGVPHQPDDCFFDCSDEAAFRPGDEVVLCNLAKAPHLNDQFATVLAGPEDGRFRVQLAASDQCVRVRPHCLCRAPATPSSGASFSSSAAPWRGSATCSTNWITFDAAAPGS